MESSIENEILNRLKHLEKMMLQNTLLQKAVLNLEEAAEYLMLSVSYLYKLTSRKLIPHFKSRGKILSFDRLKLDDWNRRNAVKTKDEVDSMAGSKLREKSAGK
jgi:excisionase family DNA binding protein